MHKLTIGIALYENHHLLSENLSISTNEFRKLRADSIQFMIYDDSEDSLKHQWFLASISNVPIKFTAKLNNTNLGELQNIITILRDSSSLYFTWLEDDDPPNFSYYHDAISYLDNNKEVSVVAPIMNRFYDQKFWYVYHALNTLGMTEYQRILHVLEYCLVSPNALEHIFDRGVFRSSYIPSTYELKYSKSIPLFVFILACNGHIVTLNHQMTKNTTHQNLVKYRQKTHATRVPFLRYFGRKIEIYAFLRLRILLYTLRAKITFPAKLAVFIRIILNQPSFAVEFPSSPPLPTCK